MLNIFKSINKQYKADLTRKPLRKIENAVGDSTCTFSNQKWKGAKGILTPNPTRKISNKTCDSSLENCFWDKIK